jgi:DNA-binding NtrC family response regulator
MPATHDAPAQWRARFAPEILGDSARMLDVFRVLERIADTDCTVLIVGESGVGKELVARALHRAGGRAQGPFVPVNCAAIPRELMESEMFGHARGAFTGATQSREGRFQAADGGTLFLDEIGEMDAALQCKLLRAIQDRQITPVGEVRATRADARIVAATHRDLEALCSEGRFREDLFWRLNVVPLCIPPLRERGDDVLLLARRFVDEFNRRHGRRTEGLTDEAELALRAYDWPGNVRQLENSIERAVILKREGMIDVGDLPARLHAERPATGLLGSVRLPASGVDLNEALEECEVRLILQALDRTGGNKAQAATLLHLNRTTLVEKLRKRELMRRDAAA